jgi:folate-binding protein YgfZ
MKTSPLHAIHEAAGATFSDIEDTTIPGIYSDSSTDYAAARDGAIIIDLAHIPTGHFEGPDARRFCNGMFTNNVRDLQTGQCNRSAMCDDRGRVLGLLDILCSDTDRFEIILEGVTSDWFESRYGMYIVFDDVEMEMNDSASGFLTLQGAKSADILRQIGLPSPDEGHHLLSDTGVRVVSKNRSGLGGFDLIAKPSQIESLWASLMDAGAHPAGFHTLERLRIEAGYARWPVDGSEKSLVHELSIDSEVCSFNKGCYLGQEVINRVDVKGQVVKKLHRIVLDTPSPDLVGATILLDDTAVGTVTSATDTDAGAIALAVIRKRAWGHGTHVHVSTDSGTFIGSVQDPS